MKSLFTLIVALSAHFAYGQGTLWNKTLPTITNAGTLQISAQPYEDGYLISYQKKIVALNQLGEVTGAVLAFANLSTGHALGGFIRPKIDPLTGAKYFLLAGINLSGTNALAFSEYRPDQGFVHATLLDEMWGQSALSPVFLDLNDSTYLILGRKYFRQVTHRPGLGMTINWERSNVIGNPNAGVKTPDGVVGVTQNGVVFALDNQGNTLWADTTDYVLRDIQSVDNGFLAVGRTADSSAALIRFSSAGTIVWTKEYANDFLYNRLLVEAGGNLLVTGQSDSLKIVLRRLSADGTTLWRNTYQPGAGSALLPLTDGYLVAGQSGQSGANCFVLRTNGTGNTGPQEVISDPHRRILQNDQIREVVSPSANLFWDLQNNNQDSLTGIFYSVAPWFAGTDHDGLLYVSADTYANSNHSDFRTGFSKGAGVDFNRVWRVTKAQIRALQQDWADNGVLDQPIPFDISTWPAKGNAHFTDNLNFTKTTTDKALLPAPFVDANGDGLYDPADGDYPRIKGDQMAWWILTDDTLHANSGGRSFTIDLGISMYTYDACPSISELDRSLLVDLEVVNRSENAYAQMFAGIWADPFEGCGVRKLLGSLPAANAFYAYGNDTTNTTCPVMVESKWASSISFINHPLNKFIYYNNGGGTPSPPVGTDDPGQDKEYYNYIRGRWRDGTIPTYNGQPIDFLFPDNPADPTGNSMCAANTPYYDRRMIGSHGPFDLAPNDTFRLTVAFTYHPDLPGACPDIFGTVKNDLDQLHDLINSGALAAPPHWLTVAHWMPGQSVTLDAGVTGATAYLWSNGATTATITVDQPGEYSVTITRVTGCASVETVLVTAATPTQEAAWLDQLRLFPNPTAGQFQVEVQGAARDELEFTLVNALGQVVAQQVADFRSGSLQRSFDYRHLPAGLYTLRLRGGEKTRLVKLFLQH